VLKSLAEGNSDPEKLNSTGSNGESVSEVYVISGRDFNDAGSASEDEDEVGSNDERRCEVDSDSAIVEPWPDRGSAFALLRKDMYAASSDMV
jgi:hypothetical protein